ncbi:hypothetical protein [Thermosporothrix hazakensis]|jgi:hypothetical protein|uniref:hypothetical protein n=1 Tax=Thermosporothrix hazakensis TaxID=644383 RepID=UPI000DAB4BA8|nr:hypothetical protein [Thermosporothrix hazakensis]
MELFKRFQLIQKCFSTLVLFLLNSFQHGKGEMVCRPIVLQPGMEGNVRDCGKVEAVLCTGQISTPFE